jgi:hypothetical protein
VQIRCRRHRAGRHADAWFDERFRAWQRRVRPVFALAILPTLLMFAALAVIWPSYRQFYAGVTLGCVLTMYLCLLDAPPEWIERKRRGRDGERRTERELRSLEGTGWVVAHDLDSSRGNLDHVVVGPGGAFLLETKALQGKVVFDDDGMLVRRSQDRRDDWRPAVPYSRTAKGRAFETQRRLIADGIRWVQPVVVLWSDFPDGVRDVDGVTFLHGDRLAAWLHVRSRCLPDAAIGRAGATLKRLEDAAMTADVTVVPV